MEDLPLALALIAFFGFALWGLGTLLRPRDLGCKGNALTVVLGLGLYLTVGGLLNVFHLAYGWVCTSLLGAGAMLGVVRLLADGSRFFSRPPAGRAHLGSLIAATLILAGVLAFATLIGLFPKVFNYHDDYQKYFVYPVKMLATGSLYGSPLSSIGKETFGAQSFAQAFFVQHLGIRGINAFDAVFCLVLMTALILERGRHHQASGFSALLVLLLVLIDPLYVNVSALYSTALFMMAAVSLAQGLAAEVLDGGKGQPWNALALGLCYGAAVALKPTAAPFAVIHWTLLVLVVGTMKPTPWRRMLRLLPAPIIGIACLLPWLLYPIESWLDFSTVPLGVTPSTPTAEVGQLSILLDPRIMIYSAPLILYSLLVLATLTAGVLTLRRAGLTPPIVASATAAASAGITQAVLYGLALFAVANVLIDTGSSLRYVLPCLIGVSPLALLMAYEVLGSPRAKERRPSWTLPLVVVSLGALFGPGAYARVQQSLACGSILAFTDFACSPSYQSYSTKVLRTEARNRVRDWQSAIPEGVPMLVWIDAPFHLDFARNPVLEADFAGLDNPWGHLPQVEHILWQHRGFATRSREELQRLSQTADPYMQRNALRALALIRYLEGDAAPTDIRVLQRTQVTTLLEIPRFSLGGPYQDSRAQPGSGPDRGRKE